MKLLISARQTEICGLLSIPLSSSICALYTKVSACPAPRYFVPHTVIVNFTTGRHQRTLPNPRPESTIWLIFDAAYFVYTKHLAARRYLLSIISISIKLRPFSVCRIHAQQSHPENICMKLNFIRLKQVYSASDELRSRDVHLESQILPVNNWLFFLEHCIEKDLQKIQKWSLISCRYLFLKIPLVTTIAQMI